MVSPNFDLSGFTAVLKAGMVLHGQRRLLAPPHECFQPWGGAEHSPPRSNVGEQFVDAAFHVGKRGIYVFLAGDRSAHLFADNVLDRKLALHR